MHQPSAVLAVSGPDGAIAGSTSYDSASRTVTFTPAAPLAWSTQYSASVTIPGMDVTGGAWTFTTAAEPEVLGVSTIFGDALPQNGAWDDPDGVQVATRFSVDVAGTASGVRFYEGAANTGAHTGYLWDASGTKLAEVVFTGETTEGWQKADFATPVALQAGVEYRVGLHSTTGRYAVDLGTLSDGLVAGHFTVPEQGSAFTYSTGFPASLSRNNYWVDVLFLPAT